MGFSKSISALKIEFNLPPEVIDSFHYPFRSYDALEVLE